MRSASASPRPVSCPTSVRLGGFVPLSTVDWPDQLVATVFLRGCPWDCLYCHNPHLLRADAEGDDDAPSWPEVLEFLRSRVGLLDGVVFTGGEPTAQAALRYALRDVRDVGFAVGLHTAGPLPGRLAEVLPLVDWVGFDVKAPSDEYERVTRVAGSGRRARESLRTLVASGVDFECRTTVHPDLLSLDDLARMADELESQGVHRWVLQRYRPDGVRQGLAAGRDFDASDEGRAFVAALQGRFELVVR